VRAYIIKRLGLREIYVNGRFFGLVQEKPTLRKTWGGKRASFLELVKFALKGCFGRDIVKSS